MPIKKTIKLARIFATILISAALLLSPTLLLSSTATATPLELQQQQYEKYQKKLQHQHKKFISLPQNAVSILQKEKTRYHVTASYTKKLKENYLNNYFSYWKIGDYTFKTPISLQNQEISALNGYIIKPGWAGKGKPNSKRWAQNIKDNANMQQFPNILKTGITLKQCRLRGLPSSKPAYGDPTLAGQGYPFDNLQVSSLGANQPIFILHLSKDKKWAYIAAPGVSTGWVKFSKIAYVSSTFIKKWSRNNNQYVTINKDNLAIKNQQEKTLFLSHMSSLHPVVAHNKNFYTIMVAYRKHDHQAAIGTAKVPTAYIKIWPTAMNSQNIARLINKFIGKPYGWGGLYGYRDCSATQKDIFADFAVWLPRHSTSQGAAGVSTSLDNMNNKEKAKIIIQQGIPFFTLITTSDHVLLYIGHQHGKPLVFHNVWGLHSINPKTHKAGRLVIGRAVITKLNLGTNITNVKKTWLNASQEMSNIIPRAELVADPALLTTKNTVRKNKKE